MFVALGILFVIFALVFAAIAGGIGSDSSTSNRAAPAVVVSILSILLAVAASLSFSRTGNGRPDFEPKSGVYFLQKAVLLTGSERKRQFVIMVTTPAKPTTVECFQVRSETGLSDTSPAQYIQIFELSGEYYAAPLPPAEALTLEAEKR